MLLCTDNPATRIIYHHLRDRFGDVLVIQEQPVAAGAMLRRRVARLGLARVAGQVLFRGIVVPWLEWRSRPRVAAILAERDLDVRPMSNVRQVVSINDEGTRAQLRELHPAITVVCGTRILDRATLAALNGPVVNFHAGITPLYRGVHGGYWALAERRPDLVGSTLHLVDPGIDTGEVLAQVTFPVTDADNFATYPYLHVAAVLAPLEEIVERALTGEELKAAPPRRDLPSRLRSHPTLLEYLRHVRAGAR